MKPRVAGAVVLACLSSSVARADISTPAPGDGRGSAAVVVLLRLDEHRVAPLACWDAQRKRFGEGAGCLETIPAGALLASSANGRLRVDERRGGELRVTEMTAGAWSGPIVVWPEMAAARFPVVALQNGPEPFMLLLKPVPFSPFAGRVEWRFKIDLDGDGEADLLRIRNGPLAATSWSTVTSTMAVSYAGSTVDAAVIENGRARATTFLGAIDLDGDQRPELVYLMFGGHDQDNVVYVRNLANPVCVGSYRIPPQLP